MVPRALTQPSSIMDGGWLCAPQMHTPTFLVYCAQILCRQMVKALQSFSREADAPTITETDKLSLALTHGMGHAIAQTAFMYFRYVAISPGVGWGGGGREGLSQVLVCSCSFISTHFLQSRPHVDLRQVGIWIVSFKRPESITGTQYLLWGGSRHFRGHHSEVCLLSSPAAMLLQ